LKAILFVKRMIVGRKTMVITFGAVVDRSI
jgi:hypothetical protein